MSHGGANDNAGGALTPEQSLAEGDRVVRISYHRRMYGLGEVSQAVPQGGPADRRSITTRYRRLRPKSFHETIECDFAAVLICL